MDKNMLFLMMADDDFVEELNIPEEKKGGPKLVIIFLMLNTLLMVTAIVYFVFFYNPAAPGADKKDGKTEENAGKDDAGDEGAGAGGLTAGSILVELDPLVVNLDDVGSTRYLKLSATVEVSNADAEKELLEKRIVIKDTLLGFLSSLKPADTKGYEGKESIKEEMIKRVNNVVSKGKIKNIYFTEFVVR